MRVGMIVLGLAMCGAAAAQPVPQVITRPPHTQNCAVFAGETGGVCEDYPAWGGGLWRPPPHVTSLHVLVVGGGGGIGGGVGGAGGASGKVAVVTLPHASGPIMVITGMPGAPSRAHGQGGWFGGASEFGSVVAPGVEGGVLARGGNANIGPGGASCGGGAGGGHYETDTHGGAGGQGGSGGGNFTIGARGGVGAHGVVYLEWPQKVASAR